MFMDLAVLYILSYIRKIPGKLCQAAELYYPTALPKAAYARSDASTNLPLHAMSSTAHALLPNPYNQIMIFRVCSLLVEDLYRLS